MDERKDQYVHYDLWLDRIIYDDLMAYAMKHDMSLQDVFIDIINFWYDY